MKKVRLEKLTIESFVTDLVKKTELERIMGGARSDGGSCPRTACK